MSHFCGAGYNLSMARKPHPPAHKSKKEVERRHILLAKWREYRGLTQEALAEQAGMSKGNISQLEQAVQGYSQEGLESLAEALKTRPGYLLEVDPFKEDDILSILEKATDSQRRMIVELSKTIIKTEQ